jgi:hypothetical protein
MTAPLRPAEPTQAQIRAAQTAFYQCRFSTAEAIIAAVKAVLAMEGAQQAPALSQHEMRVALLTLSHALDDDAESITERTAWHYATSIRKLIGIDGPEVARDLAASIFAATPLQAPPAQPEPQTTGWPPSELMQDDHSGLSKALSNTPHARLNAREAAAAISQLKPLTYDDIYDIARGTGYVTRGQADEIAAAVIAKQAASPEVESEVLRLRQLAATCYAGLGGECNLPENWLDALNNAANGDPFETEDLLPFKLELPASPESMGVWINIKDQAPPCDGGTVFIGENDNGYIGCFNTVYGLDDCWMEGPEEDILVMSNLRVWQRVDRPAAPTTTEVKP